MDNELIRSVRPRQKIYQNKFFNYGVGLLLLGAIAFGGKDAYNYYSDMISSDSTEVSVPYQAPTKSNTKKTQLSFNGNAVKFPSDVPIVIDINQPPKKSPTKNKSLEFAICEQGDTILDVKNTQIAGQGSYGNFDGLLNSLFTHKVPGSNNFCEPKDGWYSETQRLIDMAYETGVNSEKTTSDLTTKLGKVKTHLDRF